MKKKILGTALMVTVASATGWDIKQSDNYLATSL